MLSVAQSRRIFFKYERRIRDLSPLHKVFSYFASQRGAGARDTWMCEADMMRSIIPVYPPEASATLRAGSLRGEPAPGLAECAPAGGAGKSGSGLLASFDVDGDGRIGFDEWLLFLTLISIPPEDVQGALGVWGSGCLGQRECPLFLAG